MVAAGDSGASLTAWSERGAARAALEGRGKRVEKIQQYPYSTVDIHIVNMEALSRLNWFTPHKLTCSLVSLMFAKTQRIDPSRASLLQPHNYKMEHALGITDIMVVPYPMAIPTASFNIQFQDKGKALFSFCRFSCP
ncbi:hypothetical protein STEG23_025400 [Scotinomys teguina]